MTVGVQAPTPTGELAIQGVSGWLSLHTYAWNVTDLLELWLGGDKRGQDRLLPGTADFIPYRRRYTVTTYSLPMVICGDVHQDGTPYADPWVGLETNLEFLRAQLIADPATTAGTRAATLTMPSGVDRSAAVHVLGITPGRHLEGTNQLSGAHGVVVEALLELSIPSGRFA